MAGKKLGISVKTVAASKDFRFSKIIENIDELAAAKKIGAIGKGGSERILKDVRRDIFVPKGYDKRVLKNVVDHAKDVKVEINITEH